MSTSGLLSLPKEIRLLIFEHALADDNAITIGLPSSVPWQGKTQRYHPPVAEASKLIRQECLSIIYKGKTVILVLRYREGRDQVQRWLNAIATNAAIRKHVHSVSIQYFEQPHRSTAMLVDLNKFQVLNRHSWMHPLLGKPLKTLRDVESALRTAQSKLSVATTDEHVPDVLRELISVMTVPLRRSRLVLCESMANARLHGYTDFQLRFESVLLALAKPRLSAHGYTHQQGNDIHLYITTPGSNTSDEYDAHMGESSPDRQIIMQLLEPAMPLISECGTPPLTAINTLSQNFRYGELTLRTRGEVLHYEHEAQSLAGRKRGKQG